MKRLKLFAALALMLAAILSGACDPGVYDLTGGQQNVSAPDFRLFLDAAACYEQLLDDLDYMKTCYKNEKLAGAQAQTIFMNYGVADMSKSMADLTSEQQLIKADLFAEIKLINLYSNNFTDSANFYNQNQILTHTDYAIGYCKRMIELLKS